MSTESQQKEGIRDMSEVSERRLWKTLDTIVNRLQGIEAQMATVVRLEERMHNYEDTVIRHGRRLDDHGNRVRDIELWQANHGDRSSNERLIGSIQKELEVLRKNLNVLSASKNRTDGEKDVSKAVFKWLSGILAALLLWVLTKS